MKLTSSTRLQSMVGTFVIWISTTATCHAEILLPGFSSAKHGETFLAARMTQWHLSIPLLQANTLVCTYLFTMVILLSLMVKMLTETVLARGGMGQKGVAAKAMRASFLCSHALRSVAWISCILCVLEFSELPFYPSVGLWCQFSLPMLFAQSLIAVTSISILKKEEQLRVKILVSKRSYRMLFERSLVGTYTVALDGRILDCNFSFCQIFGYQSREEVIDGSAKMGFFKTADRYQFICWLNAKKRLIDFEQCLRRTDGRSAWVLNSASLVRTEAGSEPFIKGTMIDISELRLKSPAWLRGVADTLIAVRWRLLPTSR